ncbi:hypothetical protein DSCO28_19660 [Desulfosarcina ovata subsp. sediminis]|uniref:Rhodanese domain-containing protein n=1 Tax=Desulfosarcina ovata subsp. sediminis TaxID=885957 RepID=A0A5K7ZQ33_9BACT|nr:rhodanese-like domain-containing protein [Desulfosarcina ovata]BBO81400.1 hypothetical protein DSCO28_19660 [Desulfosarcina ovata subsp. sediminis]
MKAFSAICRVIIGLIIAMILIPYTCLGEYRDLSAEELKGMLDSGQKLYLLNPLSDIEFNEGHIPGSMNIPLHSIMRSDKMPKNMDTLIVTYCLSQQ